MADGSGHLKVFIGMAPGVGKTYRMLQEGRAELDSGRDVVIGYLESHGRAETLAQAEGLEQMPRRESTYRGTTLSEMDLPAVLARAPELCLIDELAHTNVPGFEHEKRYEDVRDVLTAGIDVYSTVNVQHLESLGDQVRRLTGTRMQETIPDDILAEADEVVLIDLTPEALIARLRAGKVYRPERVPAALANFFKIENLSALRETALRLLAEEVEIKRLVREPAPTLRRDEEGMPATEITPNTQTISERPLAIVTLHEDAEHVVRRAWRSAQRLDADLDVLVVRPAGRAPSADDRSRLESLRRLSSMLGARLQVQEGDDLAALAVAAARERDSTYVLIGTPPRARGLARLRAGESILERLLSDLPGVDIRVVADPSLRRKPASEELAKAAGGDASGGEALS